MIPKFDRHKADLDCQFCNIAWIEDSGFSPEQLRNAILNIEDINKDRPKAVIKAKSYALILEHARLAIDKEDIFQDKLFGGGLIAEQRERWQTAVIQEHLSREAEENSLAFLRYGSYHTSSDFGHTSPNSALLLAIGFPGLLERIEHFAAQPSLSTDQQAFYEACSITLRAVLAFLRRLATAVEPFNPDNARALRQLTVGRPQTTYEAMQLLILYFFIHEYVGGTRVRTLGRLDVLFRDFYRNDIESGRYTRDELKEMMKYFLNKFWAAKVPYDLPFCLGGLDAEGNEVTNEVSYQIVETYNELKIYSPKIHIRVSEKTPKDFLCLVLDCIRHNNSSFVFINDTVAIKALTDIGIESQDALNYLPIGCYEPAVWGVEIGCTGNGGVNLAKALELVFTRGRDHASGERCGLDTGEITTFLDFVTALKAQIRFLSEKATEYVIAIEKHYKNINPDPLLSSMYDVSVERGIDVYEGGAKYNNSSMYFYGIATLVDAVAAVKRLVFEEHCLSFEELGRILCANWQGQEKLRLTVQSYEEKYGNGNKTADELAVEFSDYVASLVNRKPNGRGGVFKAALFSIDHCFFFGKRTMATPDGRRASDPLSKNLCASTAMDRNGITALIQSVVKIDHSKFPTGSVLDFVLHSSAVSGEDGLEAFYGIVKTYLNLGGFAIHGNVFCADELKEAQKHPDRYRNLQVRVCGWNAYFVNLSKLEQDTFIRQAEHNE
ncbi:MAG: hypothetical protein E7618_04365 [Ruminococcaceae bacterium]|nr:hypothetical protein [Oscillospiraceae bacterium]